MMMKKMKSKMIRKLKGKSNLSPEELEKMRVYLEYQNRKQSHQMAKSMEQMLQKSIGKLQKAMHEMSEDG